MTGRPTIEMLTEDPGQSILCRRIVRAKRPDIHNEGVWHYHPDFEITYTLKSSGKRFVGYNISDYTESDFVLIGENLPHSWITNQYTEQIVVNFKRDMFGDAFWNAPEMKKIEELLDKSQQGIFFNSQTSSKALPLMFLIERENGFNRLLHFFRLLDLLANAETQEVITHFHHEVKDSLKASNRIERIYSYILQNYQSNDISFTELSKELNMNKSSVCKFVKKVTKKTFSEIVIETRVSEACKLLAVSDMYISEVCFACGFNNLSNFNRSFKKIMHTTPKEYRNIYRSSKKEN